MNNLTKADRLDHVVVMLRANVDHCVSANMTDPWGYLEQLKKLANDGCYMTADTCEAIGLGKSVDRLRELASEIEMVRDQMLANVPNLNTIDGIDKFLTH